MIKQGVKNYFKNLKFIFNPLGATALGFVFGLSILIPISISSVNGLVDDITAIFANANVDFVALKDSFMSAVKALDWGSPIAALQTMLSKDWLYDTLQACLFSFVGGAETYTVPLMNAIDVFIAGVSAGIMALVLCVLIGVAGGYFLVRILVRRNTAKRTFRKYLLASALDGIFIILILLASAWLYALWKYSIFISFVVAFLFFGATALWEAYLVHSDKTLKARNVVNIKNIIKLFITNMIILLIAAGVIAVIILYINAYVGVFIGLALVQIAFVVIGLNAETYVISLVQSQDSVLREEKEEESELTG